MIDVWLVTSGEYSDYEVHVLAYSKDKAQQIADHLNDVERRNRSSYSFYEVSGRVKLIEDDDPLPQRAVTWTAAARTDEFRIAHEVGAWSFESGFSANEPRVERTGNAEHATFAAYGFPTEQAARDAAEEALAAHQKGSDA